MASTTTNTVAPRLLCDRSKRFGPWIGRSHVRTAGAAFFTSKGDSPSFGNYGFGTAATIDFSRHVGVEGEVGAMIATTSDLQFGDLDSNSLRADYRFAATQAKDAAPAFFGQDTCYAHRVYFGVIINTAR